MILWSHLDYCAEDIEEGDEDKIVESGGVGHLGQVLPGLQAHEGHGQHGGDPLQLEDHS